MGRKWGLQVYVTASLNEGHFPLPVLRSLIPLYDTPFQKGVVCLLIHQNGAPGRAAYL